MTEHHNSSQGSIVSECTPPWVSAMSESLGDPSLPLNAYLDPTYLHLLHEEDIAAQALSGINTRIHENAEANLSAARSDIGATEVRAAIQKRIRLSSRRRGYEVVHGYAPPEE